MIASSTLVTIDLLVAPNSIQIILQGIYVVIYLALAVPLTLCSGLHGFVAASCIAAALRCIISFLFGWRYIKLDSEGAKA